MTRKEEIEQAAIGNFETNEYEKLGFIAGAEWADQNPDKRLVYTKQELYDMGFGFITNGDIVNPYEDVKKIKKQMIDKACEWIKNYFIEEEIPHYENFIINFRKAMEE